MALIPTVNTLLGVLTVVAQAMGVLTVLALLTKNKLDASKKWLALLGGHAFLVSFSVAFIATAGSLFFSEVAGYNPCKLCWYQRIFMYPQVIILWLAWKKQNFSVALTTVVLSVMGGAIALYHYLLQIGIAPELSCSTVGYSASCSERFIMQFGYITIPLMALSAFLLILAAFVAQRYSK